MVQGSSSCFFPTGFKIPILYSNSRMRIEPDRPFHNIRNLEIRESTFPNHMHTHKINRSADERVGRESRLTASGSVTFTLKKIKREKKHFANNCNGNNKEEAVFFFFFSGVSC